MPTIKRSRVELIIFERVVRRAATAHCRVCREETERMRERASSGDVAALREMADRTEGKPRQTLSLSLERREQLEAAVEGIMRDAEAAGEPCTREEAIATLAAFTPEASEMLN